ncbi:MAG: TolC family protein [Proteobacteria bacterium]|nr:TolC family protein [Pseudomonadota bacterium]
MTWKRILGKTVLTLFLLGGCATVQTEREWERIAEISQERIGQKLVWERSEQEKTYIQQEVNRLLADGLSREEAVRIALMNNRDLQSEFEKIGIAKSDLIQAGLLTNPTLEGLFRFPSGGGRTNIEAGGFFALSDLWQIPLRKKVAAAELEVAIMKVGQGVVNTAAEVKKAYDTVTYLSRMTEETEEILEKFREIRDEIAVRRDFGFIQDSDVYLTQVMVLEAELELASSETDLAVATAHLDRTLGLGPSQFVYTLAETEPEGIGDLPELEAAVQHALTHRFDVRIAQFEINQTERALDLERARFLKHVNLGVSYERDTDGTNVFGPGLDIQVPIFDQNQARISRTQHKLRQTQKRLQALEGRIREEVTKDIEQIHLFQTRARHFREKILPLRERILEYAKKWVNAMQLNRLYLLESQRSFLESRREYVKTHIKLRNAFVDLELHLGGKVPGS